MFACDQCGRHFSSQKARATHDRYCFLSSSAVDVSFSSQLPTTADLTLETSDSDDGRDANFLAMMRRGADVDVSMEETSMTGSAASVGGDEMGIDEDQPLMTDWMPLFPLQSEHIIVGDKLELPQEIQKHMLGAVPLDRTYLEDTGFRRPATPLDEDCLLSTVHSGKGINYSCGEQWDRMTPSQKCSADLLKTLKGKDLALFDQIQKWRHRCEFWHEDKLEDRSSPIPTRAQAIKDIFSAYGHGSMLPLKQKVHLPNTGVTVDLVLFPFRQMLLSLLTDPVALQAENLAFDLYDPFKVPIVGPRATHVYDDFSSGQVHCDAWKRYCTQPQDLLCEIMLFMDKTHIDTKGKNTMEPVMMTLGIFNRSFRNRPEAWRPIGYMPNLMNVAKRKSVDDRHRDFHHLLRILLSELAAHQAIGGLKWSFATPANGGSFQCNLQIPVNCVMGDNEGNDKLCGKKAGGRGKKETAGKPCRCCNVSFDQLGKPLSQVVHKATLCSEIRKMRNGLTETDKQNLDDLGYRPFHDGCTDLLFSDPVSGLHGCTLAEILHTFQMGLAERTLEVIYGTKRITTKKKKKIKKPKQDATGTESAEEEEGDDDSVYGDMKQDGVDDDYDEEAGEVGQVVNPNTLSKMGIFTGKAVERIDNLAKRLHRHLRWQSEKRLPRTTFSHGISTICKMSGNERTGVLLLLLIILVMEHWSHWAKLGRNGKLKRAIKPDESGYLEHKLTQGNEARAPNMVKSLFLLVTFESYMRWEKIPRQHISQVRSFIPKFLDQLFRTFNRTKGAGLNTLKNHLPLHLVDDIQRFGSPQNTNSGIGEHLHVSACKDTGRTTNMNADTFEMQAGTRYVENTSIDRCALDQPYHRQQAHKKEAKSLVVESEEVVASSQLMWIAQDYVSVGRAKDRKHTSNNVNPVWKDSPMSAEELVGVVRDSILPQLPTTTSVAVHTKVTWKGLTYSCHPKYGKERLPKQDWAFIAFENSPHYPCHLLCAITIPENPLSTIFLNGTKIDKEGVYFLVHTVISPLIDEGAAPYAADGVPDQNEGTRAHVDQHLVHRIPKSHWEGEDSWVAASAALPPTLFFVPVESLDGPCVAYPNIDDADGEMNDWYFLRPVDEWPILFQDCALRSI